MTAAYLGALAALGVVLAALAARQSATRRPSPGETPERMPAGEVAVAYPEEPRSLNPYSYEGDTTATRDLLRPVLPTLLRIDPGLRYRPGLAVRVPGGRDVGGRPFSVTFHLDPKARWSDGTPITAADVRFTWETIRDPRWAIADRSAYRRVTEVQEVDPHTVRLVFDQPYPYWRDLFSGGDFVLPRHALAGKDFNAQLRAEIPLSGGPFRLESFTSGLEIVYVPNSQWWGSSPGLARVRVYFVPDIETALQLLEGGRVQVVTATSQANLEERIKRLRGVREAARFGSAWWELAFAHQRPATDDAAFRATVAQAFNRAGFVESVVRGNGRPLEHLAPGQDLAPAFAGFRFDPSGVKERLGRTAPSPLTLSAPAENEMAALIERAVQTGLRNAGIPVDLRNPASDVFYGQWRRAGEFDLAIWERRGTPLRSLLREYRSDLHPPMGANYTRLTSQEVDRVLDASERTAGISPALLDQAMMELAEALPAIPLFEARAHLGYRSDVSGPAPNATVDGPLWNLERWRRTR